MNFDRYAVRRRCFISHRERITANQLTARDAAVNHEVTIFKFNMKQKIKRTSEDVLLILAPQTGLEPVTPRLTAACSTD